METTLEAPELQSPQGSAEAPQGPAEALQRLEGRNPLLDALGRTEMRLERLRRLCPQSSTTGSSPCFWRSTAHSRRSS